jgi:hypothetical protein
VASMVSSPAAGCVSPLDRLGFEVSVGCTARSTWFSVPPAPTSFYVRRATGAHQPSGLDAPDQGAFVRARSQHEIKLTNHTKGTRKLKDTTEQMSCLA